MYNEVEMIASEERSREAQASYPRRAFPIVLARTFTGFLDTHLLLPIMALYAEELSAGIGIVGLIVGIYSITNIPAKWVSIQ